VRDAGKADGRDGEREANVGIVSRRKKERRGMQGRRTEGIEKEKTAGRPAE